MTAVAPSATPHAAGRAVEPRAQGYLDRDGVRIFYELFGDAPETILFLPPWAINHSRFWKGQVPYLSRHFSVLTFDPRGNGRSDRPESPDEYGAEVTAADALALLDELGLDRVFLVVHCGSADKGLLLTAHHPERFVGAVFMSPALPITPPRPERVMSFTEPLPTDEGWAKQNRHYWQRDYPGFLEFFFDRCFTEPHSTKQIEDGIGWALETTPDTLELTVRPSGFDEATSHELMSQRPLPRARDPGRRGRPHSRRPRRRLRGRDRRQARHDGRSGAQPRTHAIRSDSTCSSPTSRTRAGAARRSRRSGVARSRGRSGRSTSRHRSASATPGATSRSCRSSAGSSPG